MGLTAWKHGASFPHLKAAEQINPAACSLGFNSFQKPSLKQIIHLCVLISCPHISFNAIDCCDLTQKSEGTAVVYCCSQQKWSCRQPLPEGGTWQLLCTEAYPPQMSHFISDILHWLVHLPDKLQLIHQKSYDPLGCFFGMILGQDYGGICSRVHKAIFQEQRCHLGMLQYIKAARYHLLGAVACKTIFALIKWLIWGHTTGPTLASPPHSLRPSQAYG